MLKKNFFFNNSTYFPYILIGLGCLGYLVFVSVKAHALPRNPITSASPIYNNDGDKIVPFFQYVTTGTPVLVSDADNDRRRLYVQLIPSNPNNSQSFNVCLGTYTSMTCSDTATKVITVLSTNVWINNMQFDEYGQSAIYALGASGTLYSSAAIRGAAFYDTGDEGDD